jgi:hypothetical protein
MGVNIESKIKKKDDHKHQHYSHEGASKNRGKKRLNDIKMKVDREIKENIVRDDSNKDDFAEENKM